MLESYYTKYTSFKKTQKLKRVWIIACILVLNSSLNAQKSIRLLQKDNNKPIQFANVCWQSIDDPSIKGHGVSNMQGEVAIKNFREEKALLSISCVGYKSFYDTVNFSENNTILIEQDILNLDQVVVTGTRTNKTLQNSPVLTKVVTSVDLKQMGANNALEALEFSMPGVQFSPDSHGDNLQIQGLDNDYILVLVDGQRLIGETRGNVNFNRINVDNIERIEIINGASSVLYGSNAIGAVINIITKNPQKPFEASIGSYFSEYNEMRYNSSVAINQKKLGIRIDGFRNSTDGFDLTPESPASYTVSPYVDYSGKLNTSYKLDDKTRVELTGTFYNHEVTNPEKSTKSTHNLDEDYTYGGMFVKKWNSKNELTIKYSSDENFSYKILEKKNDEKINDGKYGNKVIQIINHQELTDKLNIVTGLEQNFEHAFSDKLFSGGEEDDGNTEHSYDFNALGQIDYFLTKKLEVILAGRYTYHSDFENHISPKLSSMYSLGKFKFRGNFAMGYRTPSLRELFYDFDHNGMFWIYGNPDLKPEESLYASLSTEYTLKDFNTSVTFYQNTIDNKIETIDIINGDKLEKHYMNVNKALLHGVESYLALAFLKNFKLRLGYAYSYAEDESTGLQLYGNSKHSGTTALTYQLINIGTPLSVNISGRFASSRLYQYAETSIDPSTGEEETSVYKEESNPYTICKFTFKQRFHITEKLHTEVSAGINNIFDYKDEEYQAVVDPGRRFNAGIKIMFY